MTRFFISDLHFGHPRMAELRGFNSVEEHDLTVLARYNKVVTSQDEVFLLGDICWNAKAIGVAELLVGKKHLILGNHDRHVSLYHRVFASLHSSLSLSVGDTRLLLTHIPVHPLQLNDRHQFNLHGHLHTGSILQNGLKDMRYINTSIDHSNVDYTPLSEEALLDLIKGVNNA
jgi:calcineurin-like phosphoesterase family protein